MTPIDNTISEYWYALGKDCPGKTWFYADIERRAPIYRALRIDPGDMGAVYAVAPFRLARIDERVVILAAYPCPRILTPCDENWFGIETVVAWDPVANQATILGDSEPQLVGSFDNRNALFADPLTFFQCWARDRAVFAVQRQTIAGTDWQSAPREVDMVPGCLIVGAPAKIRWNPSALPADLECVGIDARIINRAILASARLPRAFQRAA